MSEVQVSRTHREKEQSNSAGFNVWSSLRLEERLLNTVKTGLLGPDQPQNKR